MPALPRIAVGETQPGVDRRCMVGALVGALESQGTHVQPFLSQAYFAASAASAASGQSHRHLDSWLMTPEICAEIFMHGAASADLALVEGQFAPQTALQALSRRDDASPLSSDAGLDTLCAWLDLPRIAIVDVSRIDACNAPLRPPQLDGLVLDRVPDRRAACRWQTVFESLWGVPVLGMLPEAPSLRRTVESIDPTAPIAQGALRQLAERLSETLQAAELLRLASERPMCLQHGRSPADLRTPWGCMTGGTPWTAAERAGVKIAVAYDDAFNCYFPDTLDLLEARGATICDFSPLRDEFLPIDTDVVYLGCGSPERFADPLAENHCLKQALRCFVESGGRVYAEGGGLAYLCEQIVLKGGRRLPMIGALPAIAVRADQPQLPQRTEITLASETWLARRGARLRGYLNSNWRITPVGPLASLTREETLRTSLVGRQGVIGSRLHLNFAAQPAFLRRFLDPITPPVERAVRSRTL